MDEVTMYYRMISVVRSTVHELGRIDKLGWQVIVILIDHLIDRNLSHTGVANLKALSPLLIGRHSIALMTESFCLMLFQDVFARSNLGIG